MTFSLPLTILIAAGVAVVAVSMAMCLWRMWVGPDLGDRAMALDLFGIELIGMILLLALLVDSPFLDAILVLSLLGFTGAVAMAQFISRSVRRRHKAGPQGAPGEPSSR